MIDQIEKAINLARKTGDRVIIVDKDKPNDIYMIMSLEEYEGLITADDNVGGLTEEQLLDKINRDIAIWKSKEENNKFDSIIDEIPEVKQETDPFDFVGNRDEELYYYDMEDDQEIKEFFDKVNIKDSNKNKKEEKSIFPLPSDQEDEEDSNDRKYNWSIPSNVKKKAEEVIDEKGN